MTKLLDSMSAYSDSVFELHFDMRCSSILCHPIRGNMDESILKIAVTQEYALTELCTKDQTRWELEHIGVQRVPINIHKETRGMGCGVHTCTFIRSLKGMNG